ncbi:MAG: hypothetical protein ACJ8A6_06835 [Gemmatimonadales bacterium]
MRILSVVLSFVVALSLAGAGLTYLVNRIGEQRIKVQDSWISSGEEKGYRAYGDVAAVNADSNDIYRAAGDTH